MQTINPRILMIGLFFTLLSSCTVPPNLSSSSAEFSSSNSSEPNSLSSSFSSESESISATSSSQDVDLTIYFDIISVDATMNTYPLSAEILVRVMGIELTSNGLLQGAWLIANDFYMSIIHDLGSKYMDLTICFYDEVQPLIHEPIYGIVNFVINQSESMLGIQLVDNLIIL